MTLLCCCVTSPPPRGGLAKMSPLRLSATSCDSVTLEWVNVRGTSSVEVRCRQQGKPWMTVDPKTNQLVPLGKGRTPGSRAGSLVVGGLSEASEYEFTCCAVNSTGGAGPYSEPVAVSTLPRTFSPPELLVESATDTSATLTWQHGADSAQQQQQQQQQRHQILEDSLTSHQQQLPPVFITVREKGQTAWHFVDEHGRLVPVTGNTPQEHPFTAGTVVVDGCLRSGTAYEAAALCGFCFATASAGETVAFTTGSLSVSEKTVSLKCVSTTRNSMQLEWPDVSDLFWHVAIRGKKKGSSEWMLVDAGKQRLVPERDAWSPAAASASISVKRLEEGQTYVFCARGLSKQGRWGPWGECTTNATQVVMPPLKVGKVTAGTVHFEWSVPDCAVNVAIRARQVGSERWFHVDSRTNMLVALGKGIAPRASEGAMVLRGLQENTIYETAACVRTSTGWGPYSQRRVFETPPAQVTVLRCTRATDTSLSLRLNLPSGKADTAVALRVKSESDAFWHEVDADQGTLVPRGEGTLLSEGEVTLSGLAKGAQYEVDTSRETGQGKLVVRLGRPLPQSEPPASLCAQFRRCRAALLSKLSERSILLDHLRDDMDRCFCTGCHSDGPVYKRGGTDYLLPVGWSRIGVKTAKTPALEELAFKKWHTCYHGTSPDKLFDILCCGQLLKPGSTTPKGGKIPIRDGHIQRGFKRTNSHNGKNEFFDPPSQIFFSPSIKYCDYGRAYMTEHTHSGKRYRFALQVWCPFPLLSPPPTHTHTHTHTRTPSFFYRSRSSPAPTPSDKRPSGLRDAATSSTPSCRTTRLSGTRARCTRT